MKVNDVLSESGYGSRYRSRWDNDYRREFKRREMEHELGDEVDDRPRKRSQPRARSTNWGIMFAGKTKFWKVVKSQRHADSIVATLRRKGKDATALETGLPVTP